MRRVALPEAEDWWYGNLLFAVGEGVPAVFGPFSWANAEDDVGLIVGDPLVDLWVGLEGSGPVLLGDGQAGMRFGWWLGGGTFDGGFGVRTLVLKDPRLVVGNMQ